MRAAFVLAMLLTAPGARPGVGDAAPGFALTGSTGRIMRLEEFKGRTVVLAFFPKAFTGG